MPVKRQLENVARLRKHLFYADVMQRVTTGLSVGATASLQKRKPNKEIQQRRAIAKLTWKSLNSEVSIIKDTDAGFAETAVLWLPIKAYYALHYQLSLIAFGLSGDKSLLNAGHQPAIDYFKEAVSKGPLVLSSALLAKRFPLAISSVVTTGNTHVTSRSPILQQYAHVVRYIARQRENEQKRKFARDKLSLHTKKGQTKMKNFIQKSDVCFLDYFLQMRSKLNYEGPSAFEDIAMHDAYDFFGSYYSAAKNVYDALENLADNLFVK